MNRRLLRLLHDPALGVRVHQALVLAWPQQLISIRIRDRICETAVPHAAGFWNVVLADRPRQASCSRCYLSCYAVDHFDFMVALLRPVYDADCGCFPRLAHVTRQSEMVLRAIAHIEAQRYWDERYWDDEPDRNTEAVEYALHVRKYGRKPVDYSPDTRYWVEKIWTATRRQV